MGIGDYLSGRVDSWRAHPFQNGLSTLAGVFGGPLASIGAQQGFNRYNDNQFNNMAQTNQDRMSQQLNMDTNANMNAPLAGPLGDYDRGGGGMEQGGMTGMGSQLGAYTGNTSSPGAYNYGQFGQQLQPTNQSPSQFVNDILGGIGGVPGAGGGGMGSNAMGGGLGSGGMGSPMAGGGFSGFMNGASPGMMADFAAPMGGDWMARLQSHIGAQGPNQTAKQE